MYLYFSTRLKELRRKKKITQKQMAELFDLTERGYQNYELGKSTPNVALLVSIAEYFDVSIDYLLGRTSDPIVHQL